MAQAPYERGDLAAYLVMDPDGMRVYRAEVVGTDRLSHDSWRVVTTHGEGMTDSRGVGGNLVPIDEEIAREFVEKGDGFLVEPVTAIDHDIDEELHEEKIEEPGSGGRSRPPHPRKRGNAAMTAGPQQHRSQSPIAAARGHSKRSPPTSP